MTFDSCTFATREVQYYIFTNAQKERVKGEFIIITQKHTTDYMLLKVKVKNILY